jgi:hypothetical protein
MLADIIQNASKIVQHGLDISQNSQNIATNTASISQHSLDISQNTSGIATNASLLTQHGLDISKILVTLQQMQLLFHNIA